MDLITECEIFFDSFTHLIKEARPFEAKGIFHSEMLMFCSLVKALDVEQIIESGRARGQSTEIIARFVSQYGGIKFDSIEFDERSPDVKVAEERLSSLRKWVCLHYGDANNLVPRLICKKRCVLLIDGPKGPAALKLAVEALKNENVIGVFLHDVHRDADNIRPIITEFFPESVFSDDEAFVERFCVVDEDCWNRQSKSPGCEGWKPYYRGQKKMKSYSATLGFIPRPKLLDGNDLKKCLHKIEKEIRKDKSLFQRFRRKMIKTIVGVSNEIF